ncbi:hypothetical protein GI381_22685 [Salmonella enterica]|nr:hypothetical protein [Salmonella enterica]EKC3539661.1 hypothetical protein [Salmonella enterica]
MNDIPQPVAWLDTDNRDVIPAITRSKNIANSWYAAGFNVQALYAEVLLPPVSDVEPDDINAGYNICHYLVQRYLTQQGIAFRIDGDNRFSELNRNQK